MPPLVGLGDGTGARAGFGSSAGAGVGAVVGGGGDADGEGEATEMPPWLEQVPLPVAELQVPSLQSVTHGPPVLLMQPAGGVCE